MRANIDIDEDLIREAMARSGLPTKKAPVEAALARLIQSYRQKEALDDLWGLGWEGDLDAMRRAW